MQQSETKLTPRVHFQVRISSVGTHSASDELEQAYLTEYPRKELVPVGRQAPNLQAAFQLMDQKELATLLLHNHNRCVTQVSHAQQYQGSMFQTLGEAMGQVSKGLWDKLEYPD